MMNLSEQITDDTDPPSTNAISESELIAFAGGQHYPRVLMNMLEGKRQHGGFNIWAAILGVQWYFFRKLYLFGLFAIALEMMAPLLAVWIFGSIRSIHPNDRWALALILCFFATRIALGYMANIALCLKAVAVIEAVDRLNKDNAAHLRLIKAGGGVSLPSLLFIVVMLNLYKAMA